MGHPVGPPRHSERQRRIPPSSVPPASKPPTSRSELCTCAGLLCVLPADLDLPESLTCLPDRYHRAEHEGTQMWNFGCPEDAGYSSPCSYAGTLPLKFMNNAGLALRKPSKGAAGAGQIEARSRGGPPALAHHEERRATEVTRLSSLPVLSV